VTLTVTPPRGVDAVPVLSGRYVALRAVTNADYEWLIRLQTAPENMIRWRYRGTTPSPEMLIQTLWQGVLAQFIVERRDTGAPIGLVVAYNPEFRHGYASLAAIFDPAYEKAGWTLEATAILVAYLFESFPFRKLYLEVIEFNYERLASGAGSIFHVEGCSRDHEFHFGRYWHQYLLAIYRDEFAALLARLTPELHEALAARRATG
jgi:RimJ/RimL family protein N-acetyltransferase